MKPIVRKDLTPEDVIGDKRFICDVDTDTVFEIRTPEDPINATITVADNQIDIVDIDGNSMRLDRSTYETTSIKDLLEKFNRDIDPNY